jgi:Tat protein translocase TatB subunit
VFGIGMQELLVILVVALLFIGPKKLPEMARSLARGLGELRRVSDDFKHTIMSDIDDDKAYRPFSSRPDIQATITDAEIAPAIHGSELTKPVLGSVARNDATANEVSATSVDNADVPAPAPEPEDKKNEAPQS